MATANPFDQFDEPKANPFDKFDEPATLSQMPGPTAAESRTQGRAVGGFAPGPKPLTPTEQEAADVMAKVKSVPEKSADYGTLFKASFADDPETVVRTFAEARFPDMPIEKAMDRYAIVDDNIVYKAEDGNLYMEVPSGFSPQSMGKKIAAYGGKAIPLVTSLGTGIATAPMMLTGPGGMAASTGLTSLSGSAGEGLRQKIGEAWTGDPVSYGDIAKEGLASGLGQLGGGLAVKWLGRGVAQDIGRVQWDDVRNLQKLSKKYGVRLTPAELTDLPSLKAQQKLLGNALASSDDMARFYAERAGTIDEAMLKQLAAISPTDSTEIAGKMARGAAKSAMDSVAAERAAKARPIYKKAFAEAPDVDVEPVFGFIDKELVKAKGKIKTGLTEARSYLMADGVPDTSLEGLHNAKLAIDDMAQRGSASSVGNVARGKLKQIQSRLLMQMDKASPDYKSARQIFSDLSPEVSQVREGIAGIVADLPDRKLQTAAATIFNPEKVGPLSVRAARTQLQKADPEAWQSIKRAWLQDNWEKAGREFATSGGKVGQGAKFRAALLGDERRRRVLKEALEPQEYKALSDLTDLMEAASRVKMIGSDTAWNLEAQAAARDAAIPGWAKTTRVLNPLEWPKILENWGAKRNLEKNANRLVEIITSPGSIEKIKELRKVRPNTARLHAFLGQLLAAPDVSDGKERLGRSVLQPEEQTAQ